MRIVISGMFWSQPTVGSGQYLHGLLEALVRVAPEHEYILLLPAYLDQRLTSSVQGLNSDSSLVVRRWSFVVVRTPFDGWSENLAKLWFEQVGAPLAAARQRADLLHVPYFAPPLLASIPVVATVLDLIPLLQPEYRRGLAVRAYMRLVALAARRAAHVLAISESTRHDILKYLGCAPARVTTTLLAAGAQYQPQDRERAAKLVAERYGLCKPFVYYVGGLDARKNVPTLVRAFARLRRAGGPLAKLAIAGRALGDHPALFPDLDVLIAEEGIGDWVRRLDVPRADNPLLYAAATAFAYPSRSEGFGLPPLEAMACGTPTVVAEASSMPEVVGDAALRVPPDDVSGWATALWRLLGDNTLREELRRRGLARARQFNYERTARATLNVYLRAAQLEMRDERLRG